MSARKSRDDRLRVLLAALSALPLVCLAQALPALNIDIADTSVSGLSSGAFMSVQLEVAHSSIIRGVGVVAGGPYYCAQDDAGRATTRCSCTLDPAHELCSVSATSTDVASLERATRDFFARHLVDDPRNLAGHRIYVLTGGQDRIVPRVVGSQLADYYRRFSASRITEEVKPQLGHTMPTKAFGKACDLTESPYIGRCGFDAAQEVLTAIYGSLKTKPKGALRGRFSRFDQTRYVSSAFFWLTGLDTTGWLYVPRACSAGERCRLHVALHGCKQGQSYVNYGTTFVRHAGYAEWADANHIVVLYPQAVSIPFVNPDGCWDWWGYTDENYANQRGVQIAAIRAMIDRLVSGAR